ncbi:protein of unknown function [Candidatus Hydrogenisulfobacillus filiaventi]|uniref:Uncharacterized protein n=1 Tax=Candidatus Hydrogenisulfobacillus filiaventi TaxID=2707344 RepID=A0A6F8ZK39_9FIRM|nr:hypothetical protein [Bacillota bacterium]CAB1130036.1 protein of unknown function [Candidatus Hydrogenisulfobacillus filiaventi]
MLAGAGLIPHRLYVAMIAMSVLSALLFPDLFQRLAPGRGNGLRGPWPWWAADRLPPAWSAA